MRDMWNEVQEFSGRKESNKVRPGAERKENVKGKTPRPTRSSPMHH